VQESEAPTLAHVGHVLARGCSVLKRRVTTGGEEAGEGGGEARCWLGKPKRNRSSLDQTRSKSLKVTKTKENVTIE
jgi:hypothetical protein